MPESLLKQRQGWAQSSKMAATYAHLGSDAVDKAMLELEEHKQGERNVGEKALADLLQLLLDDKETLHTALRRAKERGKYNEVVELSKKVSKRADRVGSS